MAICTQAGRYCGVFYAVGDDAPDEYAERSDRFKVDAPKKEPAAKKPAKKKATAKKAK